MENDAIAGRFSLLAKLMEIHGENAFKARSYTNAAFNIRKLSMPLTEMDPEAVYKIKGIGEAIGKKIGELLQTEQLALLEKYLTETPAGILEMLSIKGLGSKKIATIWKELEVESLGELLYACNENRLLLYKGFGAKTQENIRQSIVFYLNSQGRFLYAAIEPFARSFEQRLRQLFPGSHISCTGDFRRQCEIIDETAFVITAPLPALREALLADMRLLDEDDGSLYLESTGSVRIRLHSCNEKDFALTLLRTTGNTAFLEAMEGPLKTVAGEDCREEEVLFAKAGLPYIPPPLRENKEVLQNAGGNAFPLIMPEDIKGIIHSHSQWSDGTHTLGEMAQGARDKGYEYLVISDHSRSAVYANGLTPERICAQHAEIDELNARLQPFRIFRSIESDILYDGRLDYPDEVLATFDLVIASVHSNLKMDEEKAMQRLLKAVENPYTTILGHPTGRLLLSRPGYPVDHRQLIDACARHQVVIELNAHPRRLDMDWRWIGYAREKGVLISVDPDAHSIEGMDNVRYGALAAQKGGLTRLQNLSSFPLQELEAWLQNRASGTRIVTATTEDVALIRQLAEKIWPETFRTILSSGQIIYMMDMMYSAAVLKKQLEEGCTFLLLYHRGEPAGFAAFSPKEGPSVYKLHKIYLSPALQGQGLGRKMMEDVIRRVKQGGATILELNVNRHNPAREFYEKLGFETADTVDVPIGNGYFMNDFVMRKNI